MTQTIRAQQQYTNEDREGIAGLYTEMYEPTPEDLQLIAEAVDVNDKDINQFEVGDGIVITRTGPDQEGDFSFKISGIQLDLSNEYTDEMFIEALADHPSVNDVLEAVNQLKPSDDVTFAFKGKFGMNKEGFEAGKLAIELNSAIERKMIEAEQATYDMDFEA